jgi:tetratricopeptide (TPR) repeat protein
MKQLSKLGQSSLTPFNPGETARSKSPSVLSKCWGVRAGVGVFLTVLGWGLVGEAASPIHPSEEGSSSVTVSVPQPLAQVAPTGNSDADRLFEAGWQRFQEGTAEALRAAIPLFEAAAQQYQQQNNLGREALARLALGSTHNRLGNHQAALAAYEQSLSLWQALGELAWEATTLNNIGAVYNALGDRQQALNYYQQALPLRRAVGDRAGEASTLNNIGVVYDALGDRQQALNYFQQALPLFRAVGDRAGEATTLTNIGAVYNALGDRQQALNYYDQALPLRRAVGDRAGEASTLTNIGAVYSALGDRQQALNYYDQALPLRRAVGDRAGEASTLNNIGAVYDALGDRQQALNYYDQALPLFRAVGDRAGEATTLTNIGAVYNALGDRQQALNYYDQALSLRRAVGDRTGEATILHNTGVVYSALGERQQALNYYQQALSLRRAVGDRAGEAAAFNGIGFVYSALGEHQQALDYYAQALSLFQAVGDRAGEAVTLNNIGLVYSALGDRQQALDYFNQALPLRRAVGDRAGEASTLTNIGAVYDALGDRQQALNYYNQALPLRRAVGDRAGEASTLTNIGAVYDALGDRQQALNYYQQALPLSRAVGDRAGEASTLNNIGVVYDALGDRQQALNYYQQALPLSRAVGDRAGEANTLFNRAWIYRRTDNLADALTDITAAINRIEDLRDSIQDDALRTTYFATVQDYYQFKIDLLMQLHQQNPEAGYDQLAFDTSERTRARSLIELLAESRIDFSEGSDDPQVAALVEQEQSLQQQRAAQEQLLTQRLNQAQTDAERTTIRNEVAAELNRLSRELDAVVAQLRQVHPAYANLQYPEPLTLAEVQQQVLDADTVLLQYALGDEQSYLFVVTANSFYSYALPSQAEIATTVERFVNQIEQSTCVDAPNPTGCIERTIARAGHPLYDQILAPAAEHIAGKRLLIAADGILHYTPFAALPLSNTDGYQPLLTQHEVVMTPSVTTLATQRDIAAARTPAPKTLALLADPVFTGDDERVSQLRPASTEVARRPTNADDIDLSLDRSALERAACVPDAWKRLPYTAAEAEAILALNPDTASLSALAFEATQDWVLDSPLAQYRFLHLATHGCLDAENPELSGLVLSQVTPQGTDHPDGFLRLHEIFTLTLNADLVVLSACQTGRGETIQGEGIVGMTRGFMFAGAEQVVVSLWNVNDQATAELMGQFYQDMLASGETPATALRQAQLALWEQYQDPRLWAAFTLQGDW